MTTARSRSARDSAEAFFPVEMRPLFMPTADGLEKYQTLKRHIAVVHGLGQKEGSWMGDFTSAIKSHDFSFDSNLADYRQTTEVIDSL